MGISVILFDFVGVLLVPNMHVPTTPLVEAIDARIGKVTDDAQFQQQVLQDFSLTPAQLQTVLEQVVARYRRFDPLWNLLPSLRRHFRLGVINNGTWLTYPRFNERFRLEDTFDIFISSAREGVRKPDPRIYLLACEKLGVQPENCLFMDDTEENIAEATWAGMQAIHWMNPDAGFQQFLKNCSFATGNHL